MTSFLLRRLAYGALVLLGVNLATFFLFFTVNTPDDMARLNIGGKRVTQELIDKWKTERGYDKPLYFNDAKQGAEQLTETIFYERSVSLFTFNFGRADGERGQLHLRIGLSRGQREREVVDRGHLARQTDDAEAIRPVGRHLEIDDGVIIARAVHPFDGRHLESAQPDFLGDVFRRSVDVDEIAQPGNQESHTGCL